MKKVISLVLLLAIGLTIVCSALPAQQTAKMSEKQMMATVGGYCDPGIAGLWGLGAIAFSATPFGWFCAGVAAGELLMCIGHE